MTQPPAFDVRGPLPQGTCVIEASAGTGKTWTITALTVRYVAEGLARLDQIMLVTFSRAATNELRHRVYERLRSTLAELDDWLEHGEPPADPVTALLVETSRDEVAVCRGRVAAALADIDAATIATTHEFCQRMLTGLGLLVDHDHTSRFVDNVDDLAQQVVDDVYLAHESVSGSPEPPGRAATFARFADVGRAAIAQPDAALEPVEAQGLSLDRTGFASRVREQFDDRKRRAGVYTFDDMVGRLRDALFDAVTGPDAVATLARRYPVVLIDEFQDTDPSQWDIVRRAFVGHSTLVLIGDPKQAIYAFRGADVYAYLAAVDSAATVYSLPRNHRSDKAVVDGILDVFAGTAMGDPRIVAHPVQAAHEGRRLRLPQGAQDAPAVQLRVLRRSGTPWSASAAARRVDADLTDQVVGLLEDGWVLDERGVQRPLRPSDIAVLVRSNWRGEQIREALLAAGVHAVFGGAQSVMASEAAQAWLSLLRALTQPSNQTMKRAALGCLIGWSETDLAQAVAGNDARLPGLAVLVKTLSRILAQQGIAAVFEALCDQTDLYQRLLSRADGERVITDVRHVSQLLNDAATRRQLGAAALTAWLSDRIDEARRSGDEDRTRRLETDVACVQIMTIHGAKGLEFPVVLLPEAANQWQPEARPGTPYVAHLDGRRALDVGVDAQWQLRHREYEAQEAAEALRTLYVAMTRAKSRLVMWWAPTLSNTEASALHRLLNGPRRAGGEPLAASYPLTPDPVEANPLDPRLVEVVEAPEATGRSLTVVAPPDPVIDARRLTRPIDRQWRRTSYSGLTADVHGERQVPPEVLPDEPTDQSLEPFAMTMPDVPEAPVSRLASLPGGTQFGSLVHGVLEVVDAASPTLPQDLAREVGRQSSRLPVAGLDPVALAEGLEQVVHTPLTGLAPGLCLADVPRRDWLAELDFELPMGRRTSATLADIAAALTDPALVGDDAFAARYGHHLATSPASDKTLTGFLTGSIDVVLRVPDPDAGQRYLVLDYKTNRIPVGPGEELTVLHYVPEAMATAMVEAHYPLQALLYSVALHRFLTWRLPGYRPEQHLGGVGYLFVRGMAGEDTPLVDQMTCGVFTWHPSPRLVGHVSDLLGGAR